MSEDTSRPATQIEWIAPARDVAALVHTLFVIRTGEGSTEDVMPAYSAQLFMFVRGKGTIHFAEDHVERSGDITLNAPMLSAAPIVLDGPVLNVGASFTPLGWAMFSGLAADKVHDTSFEAEACVSERLLAPLRQALADARSGKCAPKALCQTLENTIRFVCEKPLAKLRDDHRALLSAIDAWLGSAFNPPVSALYESVDLGQRQVQRLCKRYYGVPPAQLIKRYRAIRAAMLLAHEDLPTQMRDEVLSAYFDQAHLIHDIRRYTGRTPKRLPNEPFAQNMLDPEGHGRGGEKLRKREDCAPAE